MSAGTELGAIASASHPDDGRSGFRLLPSPDSAFDARLALITRARRAVDVQYYEVRDDDSGRAFLRALRDAAQRGVRIRLLIDDLHTAGEDALLLGFREQPNVEVRLFNPFPAGRDHLATRVLASAHEIGRIDHRMHNKMLVADGAFAVVGGRNVADDYFLQDSATAFLDLDLLVVGELVTRLGEHFDRYWNGPYAYPVESIVAPADSPGASVAYFDAHVGNGSGASPHAPVASLDILGYRPLSDELRDGRVSLIWANGTALADVPDVEHLLSQNVVRESIRNVARNAQHEFVVTTPYLIPGAAGMATFEMLRERGVSVTVVTNSLAAIDEPIAFSGYLRYREPMLRAGVEVYEVTPGKVHASRRFRIFRSSRARLHAKSAVIDRRIACIGSVNMDPRSDFANTETAVLVDSAELAGQILTLVDLVKQYAAYHVRLASDGATTWESPTGEEVYVGDDPETSMWERAVPRILEPFVPEQLL